MGGTGGACSEREGGAKPGNSEESTTTARESATESRNGQVLYYAHIHTITPSDSLVLEIHLLFADLD